MSDRHEVCDRHEAFALSDDDLIITSTRPPGLTGKSDCCTSLYVQGHFLRLCSSTFLSHLSYAPLPFTATAGLLYLPRNALTDY